MWEGLVIHVHEQMRNIQVVKLFIQRFSGIRVCRVVAPSFMWRRVPIYEESFGALECIVEAFEMCAPVCLVLYALALLREVLLHYRASQTLLPIRAPCAHCAQLYSSPQYMSFSSLACNWGNFGYNWVPPRPVDQGLSRGVKADCVFAGSA
jgi:hypothetical protein